MVMFSVSAILILILWILLTYVFVFSGKTVNEYAPQYLINRFEQYVQDIDGFSLSEEGKQILSENELWAQIIDGQGNVLAAYNAPAEIPNAYDIFQISNYVMNSDMLGTETLFIMPFAEWKGYGVIIGCDSSKVSKMNIRLTGGTKVSILKSILILMIVFVAIGILSGVLFSKNLSNPVNDIIENINRLEADGTCKYVNYENLIFQPVFNSLEKLQLRLTGADRERRNAENQRREWITNISHDIKTPLSTINGYAEIMMDKNYEISDIERYQYSEKIIGSVHTIMGLLEELKFGRLLENGEVKLQKEEINVCKLLKECCDNLPADYRGKNIIFDFRQEPIYVSMDKQLMIRCFTNIISNAIIHNENNADIVIQCYREDRTIVKISDNGKGMDAEEVEKIFQRFYRGKSSKEIEGSGLGLSIAKEIVNAHNGDIIVESKKGKGTVFTISL